MTRGAWRAMGVAALLAMPAACDHPSGSGGPAEAAVARLRASAPEDTLFAGSPGLPLDTLQAVQALDDGGAPVPGVTITWSADQGGTFIPATSVTDAQGIARARWTLGGNGSVFSHAAQAGVGTALPVRFYARVVTSLTRRAGDGRTVATRTFIPVAVNVVGSFGAVPGARVRWRVAGGGGLVQPGESEPDGDGIAEALWAVGDAPGTHTLTASVAGRTVTFTATVVAPAAAMRSLFTEHGGR